MKKSFKKTINDGISYIINFDQQRLKDLLLILTAIFVASVLVIVQQFTNRAMAETKIPVVDAKYALESRIRTLVKGYPIEQMIPYIAEENKDTAAFLVGIAKKESNWGKRKPVFNGEDCYNYWGFRGESEVMGSGGHTCFSNPQEAVEKVSERIDELIKKEKIDTPTKMVVWKCGYSCDGHDQESVEKWIKDVGIYYKKTIK